MSFIDKEDKQLVSLLSDDDEQAFRDLYVKYKHRLFVFSVQILKDKTTAEDLVQDIFTYIWESRRFINPDCNFSSYLFTISKNRILNILKRIDIQDNYINTILNSRTVTNNKPDHNLIENEYKSLLKEAIEKLSPTRKKVFVLSRMQHMTHKEIASELNISVYTVQEHISESLKMIKRYLSSKTDIHFSIVIFLLLYF